MQFLPLPDYFGSYFRPHFGTDFWLTFGVSVFVFGFPCGNLRVHVGLADEMSNRNVGTQREEAQTERTSDNLGWGRRG